MRAATQGEWQPVDCANAGGYVHVALITWSQMAAPEERDDGGQRERDLATVAAGLAATKSSTSPCATRGIPTSMLGKVRGLSTAPGSRCS